jgi:hypothetical protein
VGDVETFRQFRSSLWKACNIALLVLAAACTQESAIAVISQEQAESVRDECVGASLRLLQELSDRLAPLARADGPEERAATAFELGCEWQGDVLVCPALGLELEIEERPAETAMLIRDLDPLRGVTGEIRIYGDPARGLVLTGHLQRIAPSGCEAILGFEELVALEAYGLPGGALGLYFSEGSVDVTVLAPDAALMAHGSAALTGRHALVALNFDGRRLLDEIALD